jgi:hypothetical protein
LASLTMRAQIGLIFLLAAASVAAFTTSRGVAMIGSPTIALLVTVPSFILIRHIQRTAESVRGEPLPRWARLLIPIPIVFFLAANLDGVISFLAYIHEHPVAVRVRSSQYQAWSANRLFYPGLAALVLLPFPLVGRFSIRLSLHILVGHFLWLFFPLIPLALASGVPFRD